MVATAPPGCGLRLLCPLLLLLLAATALHAAGADAGFQEAARSLGDGRGSAESGDLTEEQEAQHVMRVPTAAAASVAHGASAHRQDDIPPGLAAAASLPDVPRLVALALSRLEAGSACGGDSASYLRELNNFTLWALQMYDASVKAPTGVVYGSVYQLGHFDQCVSAREGRLRGQYCLPEVQLLPQEPQPMPPDPYSLDFPQDQSAWLKLQFAGDQVKIRRDQGWWALCVPASCSVDQLQRALDAALREAGPRMRVTLRAHLRPDHCSTGQPLRPGRATVILVCVVATLLVLSAIGSYCDAHESRNDALKQEKNKGVGRQILKCFSVQRNYRNLITINRSNMNLEIFAFMRTFGMLCIIAGHRLLIYYLGFPIFNGEDEDSLFRHPASMLIANAVLIVDMFFTIGAMTLMNPFLNDLDKGMKFHRIFLLILNRYVRLTPLYAMVILFHCGVLPYMGTGPLWKATVLQEKARCETNWWTNLLYVNNYVHSDKMCMFQSWYMCADFHFFIVCLFLGYVMWRWPVAGWTTMGCVTILSMALPFMTVYLKNLQPMLMPFRHVLRNLLESEVFNKLYITSHNRATAYLLGVMVGVLVHRGRNQKRKMNEVTSYVVFVVLWGAGIALLFSAYVFFIPGRPYNAFEAAIYGALIRPAMAVLICIYGAFPVISNSKSLINFLSAKVFVIIGRLSFAAYLIHPIPQLYDQGSLRQPRHLDVYSGVWLVVADYCILYSAAAVLTVLVEMPFRQLMKMLLRVVK